MSQLTFDTSEDSSQFKELSSIVEPILAAKDQSMAETLLLESVPALFYWVQASPEMPSLETICESLSSQLGDESIQYDLPAFEEWIFLAEKERQNNAGEDSTDFVASRLGFKIAHALLWIVSKYPYSHGFLFPLADGFLRLTARQTFKAACRASESIKTEDDWLQEECTPEALREWVLRLADFSLERYLRRPDDLSDEQKEAWLTHAQRIHEVVSSKSGDLVGSEREASHSGQLERSMSNLKAIMNVMRVELQRSQNPVEMSEEELIRSCAAMSGEDAVVLDLDRIFPNDSTIQESDHDDWLQEKCTPEELRSFEVGEAEERCESW